MTEEYKYGIIFYLYDKPDKIIHAVLYHEQPSNHDYFHLGIELATDEEFGLSQVAHKLTFKEIQEKEIRGILKFMKRRDDNETQNRD
jgi:hypothetical protein